MGKYLGIEFGSTRIKAVLTDERARVIAQGFFEWENKFSNGIWTYGYDEIKDGLRACYKSLKADYQKKCGETLTEISAIGVSAMMHGFIALNTDGEPLAPFKTWRCGDADEQAKELTKLFSRPVPARWTAAHLYKAVKERADYLPQVRTVTTLAGYVHLLLTGRKVLGIGDASGVFPIDVETCGYDRECAARYESVTGLNVFELFPKVLRAGEEAGRLTEYGAKLLDIDGDLKSGIPFCPPEGDAGTGMVATNSVKPLTGNVSAGTSVFSMAVLDKPLLTVYDGVDIVATPDGKPVAMVHCNNCSSEINAWTMLFAEAGGKDRSELYERMFELSLKGDEDCGGVIVCNYLSGENLTEVKEGVPFVMHADKGFNLANFMRAQLYSAFATLKIGNDEFIEKENIKIAKYYAHGGLFKTKGVCQKYLAAALNAPVSVMTTAGEGGAWGMAILAAYLENRKKPLFEYLESDVFADSSEVTVNPNKKTVKGFNDYVKRFQKAIEAERLFEKV